MTDDVAAAVEAAREHWHCDRCWRMFLDPAKHRHAGDVFHTGWWCRDLADQRVTEAGDRAIAAKKENDDA